MVRVGEMMVIIRAQDFASRTLHRVSGELGAMQKQQIRSLKAQRAAIPFMQKEAQLLSQLHGAQSAYTKAAMASGSATFGWTKQGRAMGSTLQYLQGELAKVRKNIPTDLWGKATPTAAQEAALTRTIKTLDAQRLHRFGAALSGLGRTMQLFGAVGVASFGLMANSFANFSKSTATAATQMRNFGGDTAQVVARSAKLREAITDMMMEFPASADEMSNAAYEIFSSMNLMENGVTNVTAGLELLKLANKAAVAGGVDLASATNAMIIGLNSFLPTGQSAAAVLDDIFNIVRFGKIRLDDLSKTFSSFASVAAASGLTLKSVGAAFSTLTLLMEPGRAAAGLGRIIELFRTPVFAKGFQAMGIDIFDKATHKMRPLLDIFREIAKTRPDLVAGQTAAVDFFIQVSKASGLTKAGVQGTVQARRAFEQLITHMGLFANVSKNVANNQRELQAAFEARMADPGVQWDIFKNQLKALVLIIGQEALPVFIRLGNWIAGAVRWFRGLNDGVRGTIIRWLAWFSIGTLLLGVFTSMIGSIIQLAKTITLISLASKGAEVSLISLRAVMITTGVGAVLVLGSIAVMQIIKHWDYLSAYFQAWREDWRSGWEHLWNRMVGVVEKGVGRMAIAVGELTGADTLRKWGEGQLSQARESWNNLDDTFSRNVRKFYAANRKRSKEDMGFNLDAFLKRVNKTGARLTAAEWQKYWDTVGGGSKEAANMVKAHTNAIQQATENMNNTVKTATDNLVNMYEQLQQANQQALGGLFQGPTMQGVLGNVFSNINDSLRQFGVQIPVPFNILKQDLEQSVTYFKRWRADIAKVGKRLPKDIREPFMAELQAMGIQGIPILEGLMSASPAQFRSIIRSYRQGQKLTDKATKDDMKRKLEYWNQFGKDAAWQMIMGIISNPKNAKIAKMYEEYVRTTYGAILKKAFQEDVAEYMKNAIADAKAQAAAANIMPKRGAPPSPFGPTVKPTFAQRIARQDVIQAQQLRVIKRLRNFMGPLSPVQQEQLAAAQRTLRRSRRTEAMLRYRQAATPTIRRQMAAQRGHGLYYNINYEGEKITILADGATVDSVSRALARQHFRTKNKGGKRNPNKVYPKTSG